MGSAKKLTVLMGGWLVLVLSHAWAAPVDLSEPSGQLGSADMKGGLQIWREVEGVGLQLGKSSYLPLRFKFSSVGTPGAGMLGAGFYCPMFEARNALIRPKVMRADLPCGKVLYFWGDTADETRFQTVDKEWTGSVVEGGGFIFWRDDGWKLTYRQSRLSELVTDDKHVFSWDYAANGMAEDVKEDGYIVIEIDPNGEGQADDFVFKRQHYKLEYGDRPLMQVVMGETVVGSLARALGKFQYPDGKFETFEFGLTEEKNPTLTFTDEEEKQTVYTWDAATNHLASEKGPGGDWTYSVGKITGQFGLPPLSRKNAAGKSEAMNVDTGTGTYTATNADGTTTVTHVFKAPGPLYNKVQKVEKTIGKTTAEIYRASYDETGRLLRSIDEKGYITTFHYDPQGHLTGRTVSLPVDPKYLAPILAKEKELMKEVQDADPNTDDKDDALEALGFFYIAEMHAPEKALKLLPEMSNSLQKFNVRMHSIEGNDNLTESQKATQLAALLKDFPEQQKFLANLISIRQQQSNNQ
jgi:YD repeat-containing protein